MTNFNTNKRCEFPYLQGMVIAFMTSDLYGKRIGTINKIGHDCIELTTGEVVNKALVFNVLSKEKRSLMYG